MSVESVDSVDFDQKVLSADRPVVVDVWAPWCGPCRAVAPNFEEASNQYGNKASFLKLNADDNQDVLQRYKVMGIPTMLYFSHGKLVDRKTGVQSASAIGKRVEPLLEMDAETAGDREIRGWFRWPFRRR